MLRLPDIEFTIESVCVEPYSVAPQLNFALRIAAADPHFEIENILLHSQARIAAGRRHYSAEEQERLSDIFGAPQCWGRAAQSLLWTQTTVPVQRFLGSCLTRIPVACSFDFNVAANKYFYGLAGGEVLLEFLFSGSLFYRDADGMLQSGQIPWSKESQFQLPVRVWRELMELYYPNSAWLRLSSDAFAKLYHYKRQHSLTGWDQVIEHLVAPSSARRAEFGT